jgi:dihydrolipoamide dehydrogenase
MYDLAVIGGGPGGYVAAICGAREGLKTLLVEKDAVGGTCLNRGCIPTKRFVHDAELFQEARSSPILKGTETLSVDVPGMVARKRGVVRSLVTGLGSILRGHGIEVVRGAGELTSSGMLTVTRPDGTSLEYRSAHVIVATGPRPASLPFARVDGRLVQTTDDALDDDRIPGRIVILGGGVIGVEMASIYLNLGVKSRSSSCFPRSSTPKIGRSGEHLERSWKTGERRSM